MGEKLKRLTIGSVGRDVQLLTAGEGIDISATGVISADLSDLYTKTEIDTMFDDYYTADEVDTELADYYTKTEVDTELADYYTKTEADTEYAKYMKKTDAYTKTEVDTKLGDYYKKTETYSKTETDTKLGDYYKKTETYSKTEANSLLANKVDKVTGKSLSTNDYTNADKAIVDAVTTNLAGKVDKVTGKGLSTNDYTTTEKNKLAGIEAGAEVNVQSDWNVTDTTSDAFIKNKPTIPDVSNFYTKTQVDTALGGKVDKVTGKGLSTNDYTAADKAIVDAVTTNLAGKVDKVTGKGLSTNDYSNADKAIVDGVTANLNSKVDKVTGKGLSTNDYTDADKAIVDGVTTALAGKQNTLTAGSNITISGNTISATDTKYTAGTGISISSANVISATGGGGGEYTAGTGLSLSGNQFSVKLGYTTSGNNRKVQADSSGNLYVIQKDDDTQYTAGTNVQISSSNVISATDTKYTAGTNVQISSANVISATDTKYTAGAGLSLSGSEFSAKTGYTTSGNNRAVQTDSSGNLYVVQKDSDTTYTAGTGLALSGTTFNHSNSVTALTTAGLRKVTYDAQGHITSSSAVTKADLLGILGYEEVTLEMKATDGTTVTKTILAKA